MPRRDRRSIAWVEDCADEVDYRSRGPCLKRASIVVRVRNLRKSSASQLGKNQCRTASLSDMNWINQTATTKPQVLAKLWMKDCEPFRLICQVRTPAEADLSFAA